MSLELGLILLQSQLGELTNSAIVGQATDFLKGNWMWLVLGIVLIAVTVWVMTQIKNILVNSILGIVAWAIITFVLPNFGIKLQLNFVTSLIASALLGLGGIGLMIILKFLGLNF